MFAYFSQKNVPRIVSKLWLICSSFRIFCNYLQIITIVGSDSVKTGYSFLISWLYLLNKLLKFLLLLKIEQHFFVIVKTKWIAIRYLKRYWKYHVLDIAHCKKHLLYELIVVGPRTKNLSFIRRESQSWFCCIFQTSNTLILVEVIHKFN